LLSGYGQLYSTTDGGVSWTLDYTAEWGFYGPSVMFHSLSFSNGTGYVCGSSGLIKRFEKNTNGIVEHENLTTALNVFPNPCYGATNLNVNATGMRGDCVLAIVNGIGQVVFEKVIRNVHHQPVFNVTGLSLPAGTYGVALRSEDQTMSTMIVITD
ncbi:MAG TPA: hypothetical protein VEY71_09625, partial [Chitinophagales bacterium]|nr:hypothetical protein [Chitinophagales bacterium]